jgi:PAS domain S-box-containing protein
MSGKKRANSKAEKPPAAATVTPADFKRRILILAPTANDARLTLDFLTQANLSAQACGDVAQLCHEFGRGCGAIILAEETLGQSSMSLFVQTLAGQPSWSDIPIILIISGGEASQTRLRRLAIFGPGGNVTLLERPFHPATLISTVEAALRSRQRQYESHQLMEKLREARAHIEAALGIADVGTWTWDIKDNHVHADKNMARIFSLPAEDAVGGPVEKYYLKIHPDDRAAVEASKKAAMQSESGEYEMDYRLPQPDGTIRWVTSRGRLEKDAAGAPARFLGVIIDITERKQAEAMLRQNEALFAALVDLAPTGVYVVDAQFRLQQINALALPAFAQVEPKLGRDFGEVMNILWGPELGGEIAKIFRHTLATGERYVSPRFSEFRRDLGEDRAYEWEIRRVTLPDHSHGVVCYFDDITERMRSEQALLQAKAAAEAASRAKDDFLAALSHELRTPLNPALLIASESADNHELPEAVRLNFETIRKNIELEASLIDDLLDLTRVTAGKMVLNKSVVDVHGILRDALATIQAEQQEKKLQLDLQLAAPQAWVEGDAVRLQQVFWNVLKNAVKFTPLKGKIALETSVPAAGRLLIKVTDTGIGMNAAEIARVFTAFAQGDHAGAGGSHRFGGLGLGLAISKNLVELHAGTIHAHSAGSSQGSTFTIELPLAKEIKAGRKTGNDFAPKNGIEVLPDESISMSVSMTVLLVEDHEITRTVLAQLLTRRNYRVVTADSIAQARDIARQHKFDLLISDIGLPDGNGNDLMSEFQIKYGLKGIALTGYGMEQDIARGKAAGFVTHLTKPVRIQSLENALSIAKSQPLD